MPGTGKSVEQMDSARAEQNRPYRLREETQALDWTEPVLLENALRDALRSAKECAAACLALAPVLPQSVRAPVVAIFGVSSLAAERLEEDDRDRTATLGLCVRIIDANLSGLDEAGLTEGAGAAARRCADGCRRALAALYLCREESA